ncbi:MAG: hypothetical protein AB1Z98_00595 [Nannocystaceae bacterium]
MKRLAGSFALALCVSVIPACDSGDKKGEDKGKAAESKDGGDAKAADAKAEDGGDAKAEAQPAEPVKLAELSLQDAGLEAKMQAPEGAKASEDFGAYVVQAGESFQLQVNMGAADLAASKQEIEGNTVNKLKSFITESETELVYESEVMGKTQFHFLANVEVDGAKYNCEDKKGQDFSKADVDAMLAACKSMGPT